MIDEPVTDIVFVSEKENCPEGYKLIEKCPCGHEAQLWEKVLGGHSGERFLCFTKQAKDDDLVIEDMYIPSRSAQYLYKGYKIIKQSVEGDEPMYHKQLAVKKVPRSYANKVIADIIICRSRDNVSKMYKKLDKVNGLCICFRQVDVGGRNTPSPKHTRRATTTSSSPSSPSSSNSSFSRDSRGGSLKIGDVSRNMAGMKLNEPSYRRPSGPSLPLRRSVSPLASHSQVSTSPSPQPPSSPPHGEATALHSPTLHSPPPPPPLNETTDSNGVPTAPPTVPLNTSSQYPQPPPISTANTTGSTYPPPPALHSNSQYPPPQPSYPPPATNYPPPSGGSYQSTYPPPPPAAMSGPPAAGYGGGGSLGFGGIGGGGHTSYPPHPPPSQSQGPPPHGGYGGYGAIAGSSFVAAPMAPQGGGSAPYNPYSQQPQGQMMSPYPNPPGQRPPTAPPASSFQNYGFKF